MVEAADISPDGSFVSVLKHDWEIKKRTLTGYWLEYEYAFPGFADWDEGVRPYLDEFLTLYPHWMDEDFDRLIAELQNRGYGWIKPDGIRAKLKEMVGR